VHGTPGLIDTSSIQGSIFKSTDALGKMNFMIFLRISIMNPIVGIFLIEEMGIKCYIWVITSPQYLKMQENMSRATTIFRGWVSPFKLMKFPYSRKWYLNLVKYG